MTDLTHQALADAIHAIPFSQSSNADHVAAVALAHLRPVVTTSAEIAALPTESVIRDHLGNVHTNLGGRWYEPADEISTPAVHIALPATVLFRPAY